MNFIHEEFSCELPVNLPALWRTAMWIATSLYGDGEIFKFSLETSATMVVMEWMSSVTVI